MSNSPERLPAAIAYIPVLGWLYVLFISKHSSFVIFHLKQSIGLALFLLGALASWVVFTWVISWIPFGFLISVIFFTLVMSAMGVGIVALVMGISNALNGRVTLLPIFGDIAHKLKI